MWAPDDRERKEGEGAGQRAGPAEQRQREGLARGRTRAAPLGPPSMPAPLGQGEAELGLRERKGEERLMGLSLGLLGSQQQGRERKSRLGQAGFGFAEREREGEKIFFFYFCKLASNSN